MVSGNLSSILEVPEENKRTPSNNFKVPNLSDFSDTDEEEKIKLA